MISNNINNEVRKSFHFNINNAVNAVKRTNTISNLLLLKPEVDEEKDSHSSLNSLEKESGSSFESPNSLGSSFYMDRLNILTADRVLLTGKKLFKNKKQEGRRQSILDTMEDQLHFRCSFKGSQA